MLTRGAAARLGAFAALACGVAVPRVREGAAQAWGAASVVLPSLTRDADLDRAIDGGAGRTITAAVPPVEAGWTDLAQAAPGNAEAVGSPVSICWRGASLAVADEAGQRVVVFDSALEVSRVMGGRGAEPGRFANLSRVRCGGGGAAFLAVDGGPHRLTVFGSEGEVRATFAAPKTPQINLYPGDFALLSTGRWFDSWLGATHSAGPYLSERAWSGVRLVRAWNPDGSARGAFGDVVPYASTVARRVLNRVALAAHADTLWALTQGDAAIHGFDAGGRPVGRAILLPLYYRGREPHVLAEPADRAAPDGWRPNSLVWQPNVQSLAVVNDSMFAVIRYRDWSLGMVGPAGGRYVGYHARSAVEVADRRGHVVASFAVPGFARELASDGRGRLAVLTDDDGRARVLVAPAGLPASASTCASGCSAAAFGGRR